MTEKTFEQAQTNRIHPAYAKLGYTERPTVYDVARSYKSLPDDADESIRTLHHTAVAALLSENYNDYIAHADHPDDARRAQIQKIFEFTVDATQTLTLPIDVAEPISKAFLDHSLDNSRDLSPKARTAAAQIGLAIGGDTLRDAKVNHLKQYLETTAKSMPHGQLNDSDIARAQFTQEMLKKLGNPVVFVKEPSLAEHATEVADDIANFTKKHSKTVAASGLVAVVATTTFLNPAVANAKITDAKASSLVESAPMSVSFTNNTTTATKVASIHSPVIQAESVGVSFSVPEKTISKPTLIETTPDSQPTPVSSVPVGINFSPQTTKVTEKPIALPTQTIESTPVAHIDVSVATPKTISAPATPVLLATPETTASPQNTAELTPDQQHIQAVKDAIVIDGDIAKASTLIREYFTPQTTTPNPSYAATNPNFVYTVRQLEQKLIATNAAGGHSDPNYVNQSLMTLAVLDAAGNNVSVLQSKDVLALMADAKKPTDEYKGKLFDSTYLKDATAQLTAVEKDQTTGKDTTLLDGLTTYKDQITNAYATALMSMDSDAKIAADAQQIQNDEIATAQAKAEASAAKKAETSSGSSTSSEALQNLIDHASTPGEKNGYTALKFFMDNGYTAEQAAGIVGNFQKESGLDPGRYQSDNGWGPGRGYAQWEIGYTNKYGVYVPGRWDALDAYAKAQGKDWKDPQVQLEFTLHELNVSRTAALQPLKNAGDVRSATDAILVYFETPGVVINGSQAEIDAELSQRAGFAQSFFDGYKTELASVNQAHAAAAQAAQQAANQAAQAAAQKKADEAAAAKKAAEQAVQNVEGMTLADAQKFFKAYQNDPNSVNYIGGASPSCDGGPLSNCVSFSTFFVNKYTTLGGMGTGTAPGNGSTVAENIVARNPGAQLGTTPEVNDVFSVASGSQWCGGVKCGHTGVVLGINKAKNEIYIGEAACNAASVEWDGVHVYALDVWSNGFHKYANTNKYLKAPVTVPQ